MSFNNKCHCCGWFEGHHDPNCPAKTAKNSPMMKIWEQGWNDGRSGEQSVGDNPAYKLGYVNGTCALEEAQNG